MSRKYFFPIFLFCGASVIYCLPVLRNIIFWGQMDWDQFTFWNAVPRDTILRYHQFPLWNPYVNGGNVLLAHPHSMFLSPFYIFVLIFGPVLGLKIQIVIHLMIGLLGMYLLAKYLKLSPHASYLASFVFMLNSHYALHLTEGHTEWLVMAFIPWIFMYLLKGLEEPRQAFKAIIFLALILLNGSPHIFAVIVIFLVVYALGKACQFRKTTPLKILGLIFLGTFSLCAIKLFPMIEFLWHYPRLANDSSGTAPAILLKMFLGRDQVALDFLSWSECRKMGLSYEWHEYGAYVGIIPLGLLLVGAVYQFRNQWPLIITCLISLLIALGSASPVNYWEILRRLPVLDSVSAPSRFILGFLFLGAVLSGYGLDLMEKYMSGLKGGKWKNGAKFLSIIIIAFVVFDLWQVNSPIFKNAFRISPLKISRHDRFAQRYEYINFHEENKFVNFIGEETSHSSQYPIFLSNSGILESYEVVQIKQGDVRISSDPGYRGEVYLADSNQEVFIKSFSPNRIVVDFTAEDADTLVVNQNYYTGWKVKKGLITVPAVPYKGLIATPVLPGHHNIIFYYMPLSFFMGFF